MLFHNPTFSRFICRSKWYNSYSEVALKSEEHKSRPCLGWVHGLAVTVWYFQGLLHEEWIFNGTISLLSYNSSCFNRIVIST